MKTHIKIIPKNQRAKNRINEHGDIMIIIDKKIINGNLSILCKSLNKTFHNDFWLGWFTENEIIFPD
jgi:hypothetical protein